ncbi:MAG: hypothetical protein ABT15_07515 [Pseudonocardia sp. SCN 73-27]|uniref:hypothetical protein n=1 Tax=Pseudonocardia sp. SCN 73-27 TaxID=1660132 RepID=UPI00086C4678|nr:hypothetical protein [Pseudonocardia sp. SCN 73-27]ODV07901.1 MAG: hypothetical protein ABT15_07515 [Pseudonocardia sp. SCN 73-27]
MDRRGEWEAFLSGAEPGDVEPGLLDSWRRSRWSGVDPAHTDIPQVTVDADTPFVRVASPVMLGLADQLAGTSSCLALADPRGTVVWRWVSDAGIAGDLDDVGVVRGGLFAEEAIGTNGIGTALESGGPAVVLGADHYVEAFHRWACVAAPVVHPVTRTVCGAVNVTCRARDANAFLTLAASAMVQGVVGALRADATVPERRLLDAFRTARSRTTAPVLALDASTLLAADSTGGVGLDHAELWALVTEAGPGEDIDVADGLQEQILERIRDLAFEERRVVPCMTTFGDTGLPCIGPLSERLAVAFGCYGKSAKCSDELGRLGAMALLGEVMPELAP